MASYRIGKTDLDLVVLGVGLHDGQMPLPAAPLPGDLSPQQRSDLEAFGAAGWRFQGGTDLRPDFNWHAIRDFNGGKVLRPGLLALHPSGSLVILRDRLVVEFRADTAAEKIAQRLKGYPRSWDVEYSANLFEVKLRLPERDLEGLIRQELALLLEESETAAGEVAFAEPSLLYHLRPSIEDIDGEDTQWHWDLIELQAAWNVGKDAGKKGALGKCKRVAVIDLGFHIREPQIDNNIAWAFSLNQDGEVIPGQPPLPDSHGTFCAGLVAAALDDREVYGAAPECTLGLVALKDFGVCSQAGLGRALSLCADPSRSATGLSAGDGADVISCSLGLPASSWELGCALREAINGVYKNGRGGKGTPVAWACFNADKEIEPGSVEAFPPLLIVSQCDEDSQRRMSGWGKGLDLLAPGYGVFGIVWRADGRYIDRKVGSSLAAPCVAGVAALVLGVNPDLTADQVAEIITRSCDRVGDGPCWPNEKVGWGRLNARKAVECALQMLAESHATDIGLLCRPVGPAQSGGERIGLPRGERLIARPREAEGERHEIDVACLIEEERDRRPG